MYLNGLSGEPPRAKTKFCHGLSDEKHGTPSASAWSATGFTVSDVEAVIIMSTPSLVMRSPATVAARFVSDCESRTRICTLCVSPSAVVRPSLTAAFHWSTQNLSASPNAASGPVSGATKPTLMSRPVGAAAAVAAVTAPPQAATAPLRPPPRPSAAAPTPATLRKSRLVTWLPRDALSLRVF